MRYLSAGICALFCMGVPALASAQQPAPLKMGLITAGIELGSAAALDRVIAASPLIERLAATPPPAEDTDAARAAWLRANKLEGAILATQAGDQVTLTAVGPRGEVLGRVALAVGADDAEAQRALQRAAGLIGPPVLAYRARQPVEGSPDGGVKPVAEPEPPIVERPAARPAALREPWDLAGPRVTLGARYAPLYAATITRRIDDGDPSGGYKRDATLGGLSVQIGPMRDGSGEDNPPLWMDISLMTDLADSPVISAEILFGMVAGSGCGACMELGGGLRFNYVGGEGSGEMIAVQLELLGAGLRWYTGLDGLTLRAFVSGGPLLAPIAGGFGVSLTGQLELRYDLAAWAYLELTSLATQGFMGEEQRVFWTSGALGVGVIL